MKFKLLFLLFSICFLPAANWQNPSKSSQETQFFLSQNQHSHPLHKGKRQTPPQYTGKKVKEKRIYHLTVNYKTVHFTGTAKQALAINDSIPAPTLYFKEGETAVIHVTNKMQEETSIHWHGILLPNFQDGVSYLTTPPIKPGKTHTFTFTLKHAGTYWYHSHTGLQEQRGLYGAIVIEPKKRKWNYDHNLTLVLSDWTDENPKEVLRTLKRGNEWYSIKKQTTQSLYKVIRHGALNAQFQLWKQRMPGMDISDVYYPAFLMNGQKTQHHPHFKDGERIRLRVINAGASTYFWLSFGGKVLLISADGLNTQPVSTDKVLHAIGETYDFLLTLPRGKAVEFRATAQDGSGFATALIGSGQPLKAPVPPKPDLMKQMKDMAKNHGTHNHGNKAPHTNSQKNDDHRLKHHTHSKNPERHLKSKEVKPLHQKMKSVKKQMKEHKGESTHHSINKKYQRESHHSDHSTGNKLQRKSQHSDHSTGKKYQRESHSDHSNDNKLQRESQHPGHSHTSIHSTLHHKNKSPDQPKKHQPSPSGYDDLKALQKTKFPKNFPTRTIHLNLTGNMRRYVWSMNGKVLSESDKIKIKQNEVIRLILKNTTMMHHPMHLHGHFFRVLNKQGDHSPLKHTVDVPPMKTVTLEFLPDEKGDWFFHCHVLYHMKGGMARVFRTGNTRDPRLNDYPLSSLRNTDRQWYLWGDITLMTNRLDWQGEISNFKNRFYSTRTMSWFDQNYKPHRNYEMELGYEYFFTDIFRVYGGIETQNSKEGSWGWIDNMDLSGKAGIRYLLPYLVELDINLDHKMRLEVELEYELLLLSRLEFFTHLKWVEYLRDWKNQKREQEWSLGLNYIMSQSLSLRGSYDNHFGWGIGINWKL